jgi:2-phosphosulfolactate phosphatase
MPTVPAPSPYAQDGHRLRCDWGPAGADAVAPDAAVVAVVDVLSFTTTVSVAVERGVTVFPYPWRDASAAAFAREHDAVLAVGRSQVAGPGRVSLSPASIRAAAGLTRLVLPSPNGSALSEKLGRSGATVIAVCLRNASAAAAWTRLLLHDRPDAVVAVVAAGERWPDGSLRPAAEDLWGAGAFLSALDAPADLSPEAAIAVAAHAHARDRLPALLHDCAGGRELIGYGFAADVAIAAEVDSTDTVPLLTHAAFTPAPRHELTPTRRS